MSKKTFIFWGFIITCMIIFFVLLGNIHENRKTLAESMAATKLENQMIEEVMTQVSQGFEKSGYGEIPFRFTSTKRLLTVQVKDKEFVNHSGKKIESLIHDIAKEIEVEFEVVEVELGEEDRKSTELLREIVKTTTNLLEQEGYKFSALTINSITESPRIEIIIEGTKEYYNNVKDEVKKLTVEAISLKTSIKFEVKVNRKSESEIRDEKWSPIFSAIREEIDKEFEEYRGFAYSFHPEPLEIIIKTDLPNSKDRGSSKKAKEIERYVKEVIKIKREEVFVEKTPYKVIIRGQENKKLN